MGYHFREQDSFVRIVELTPAMRKQIEATIEHLISVLDHFDGDENLEEDDAAEEGGDDEDGGDYEPDDNGIADRDALYDPALDFTCFDFDGSGKKVAMLLLKGSAK